MWGSDIPNISFRRSSGTVRAAAPRCASRPRPRRNRLFIRRLSRRTLDGPQDRGKAGVRLEALQVLDPLAPAQIERRSRRRSSARPASPAAPLPARDAGPPPAIPIPQSNPGKPQAQQNPSDRCCMARLRTGTEERPVPSYFQPVGDGVIQQTHHESLGIQSQRGTSHFLGPGSGSARAARPVPKESSRKCRFT